ncbi:MAG: phosphate acyltransferase PlsX [bacterium]
MTVIALDAMGGDFAPRVPVEAAVRATRKTDCEVILVGAGETLEDELRRRGKSGMKVRIHHAPDRVEVHEAPTVLLKGKPGASVRVACALVKEGTADAVVSAGHTGALMVAAKHELGTLGGIERPAIATPLPLRRGQSILLDSGANVDCKPQFLVHFARMGQVYARFVSKIDQPRVALLSNGGETGKGNELVRQTTALLSRSFAGFTGNVEGRDLFRGKADVIVCDGFVGNLVLKTAEAASMQIRVLLKDSLARHPLARLGYWLMHRVLRDLLRRTDHREIGGSLLLGLDGIAMACHGASNAATLVQAIRMARDCLKGGLVEQLRAEFSRQAVGLPASG